MTPRAAASAARFTAIRAFVRAGRSQISCSIETSEYALGVKRRAIDYLRSSDGRMARSAYELVEMENPALFANLENEILSSDQARRIREALTKLNPTQRNVIELAYFEGLSQTEMAQKMGQPLGTIKTWVRTALRNLREELGAVAPA